MEPIEQKQEIQQGTSLSFLRKPISKVAGYGIVLTLFAGIALWCAIRPERLGVVSVYEPAPKHISETEVKSPKEQSLYDIKTEGVYCGDTLMVDADPKTLVSIDKFFAKDKNTVYSDCNILKEADPATFGNIGQGYAKDKNNVYYHGDGFVEIVPGVDTKTFMVVKTLENYEGFSYTKDKSHVFFLNKIITGADPKTFTIIVFGYAKDSLRVYGGANIITGADPATFAYVGKTQSNRTAGELLHEYTKDSKHVFDKVSVDTYRITGADPKKCIAETLTQCQK